MYHQQIHYQLRPLYTNHCASRIVCGLEGLADQTTPQAALPAQWLQSTLPAHAQPGF